MPGGVITDSQRSAELNCGNTTLIGGAKIDCPKPNSQGQMGTVHDCSRGDGGLAAAGTALADVAAANGIKVFASAFRTHEVLRKTLTKQFFPTGRFCVIPHTKFSEADCRRPCHDDILRPFS